MTDLLFLQESLLRTGADLAELERAIARDPSPALVSMTRSVKEHREELEERFLREAAAVGVDICSYRIFGSEQAPKISMVGKALETFQAMVSSVYASVKQGAPRARARLGTEVVQETAFGLAYTYSGSLGVVLTVPNERPLLGESRLDETIQLVAKISDAQSPEAVATFAERLGPAPIRAVYAWSKTHAESGLGAHIEWRREEQVRTSLFAEARQLERLSDAIERTSDATEQRLSLSGMLVGVDTTRRTFRMKFEIGPDVRGAIAESLSFEEPLRVPARYTASLVKTTIVRYSTESNEESWRLERLEPA